MRRSICVLLGCLAAWSPSAHAQRLPAAQPIPTWGPAGFANTMARAGDRLFLGGSFRYVGPPSGGLALVDVNAPHAVHTASPLPGFPERVVSDGVGGWVVVTRSASSDGYHVQHLDAAGVPLPAWSEPAFGLNGSPPSFVNVNAVLVDGSRVFVGGSFDTVNGTARAGVVALDLATGGVLSWNAAIQPVTGGTGGTSANISHLAVTNGVLVVAGYFDAVAGLARAGLVGVDAASAAVTPLVPATCAAGTTLGLAAAGGRLYQSCVTTTGLAFDALQIDGTRVPGWAPAVPVSRIFAATGQVVYASPPVGQLMALDATTGAALPGFTATATLVEGAALAGGQLFVADLTPGGATEVTAIDALTGAPAGWSHLSDAVRCLASDGTRVAACSGSVGGIEARGLAAIDLRTGRALPVPDFGQFSVTALHAIGDVLIVATSPVAWGSSTIYALSASTAAVYPWSITLDSSVLALTSTARRLIGGGNFTTVEGQPRQGLFAIDLATAGLAPESQGVLGSVSALGASQGRLFAFGTNAAGGLGLPTVAFDADTLSPLPFAPSPPPGLVRGFGFAPGRVLTAGGVNVPRAAAEWFALDGGAPIDVGNGGVLDFDASSLSQSDNRIAIVGRRGGSLGFAAIFDARTGRAAPWDPVGVPEAFYAAVHTSPGIVAVSGTFTGVRGTPVFNFAVFPTVPLAAPTALTGHVSGFTAAVQWTAPAGGTSTYVVEAGSAPGASDVAVIDVGAATNVAGTLPAGRYYVRVRAADGAETSAASNEVVLQVPAGIAVPGAPGTLTASVASRVVSLSWGAATGATSYVIEAGSVRGASDIGSFPLAGTATTFSATVPPGTYFVRMRAVNAAGTGAPSNEVTIVVP